MAMSALQKDTLRPWLKDWARWMTGSARTGFSGSTTLYRAVMSPIHDEPQSRPPIGVDPPPYLVELDAALQILHESQQTRPVISILMTFYLRGQDAAMQEFNLKRANLYQIRDQGEAAIRGYLVAVRDVERKGISAAA